MITFVLMVLGRHDVNFEHVGVFRDKVITILLSWSLDTWSIVAICCYLLLFFCYLLLFVVISTKINRIVSGWVHIRIQFRLRVRLACYTVL